MPESKYTFSELLRVFFEIHKAPGMTQADLAEGVGVALGTINGWFTARATPRHRKDVERLAELLNLEPKDTDLLLYSVKAAWVKYGTPSEELASYTLVRSRTTDVTREPDQLSASPPQPIAAGRKPMVLGILFLMISGIVIFLSWQNRYAQQRSVASTPPSSRPAINLLPAPFTQPISMTEPINITAIEQSWVNLAHDSFGDNRYYWGTGSKIDNNGELKRTIDSGVYRLTLTTVVTASVFMGGDSPFFAPTTYYMTAKAKKTQGGHHDGCGLFFDEVSDGLHSMFRTRDEMRIVSVTSVISGSIWTTHQGQTLVQTMRPRQENKLAILANGDEFFFFVNDALTGKLTIPRIANSRIDVAIIAGEQKTQVRCEFDEFKIFVPPQQ